MSAPRFVHLRTHSEYSIVDGILRIDDAVRRAREDGMPALALTDLANLFGMVKFYKAARSEGIKPLIGCDVWLSNDANRDQAHRVLLLCGGDAGYAKLCLLLSRAHIENQFRGRAEIQRSWFDDIGTAGLIALSGAHLGDIGAALLQDDTPQAIRLAARWQRWFPGAFYIEMQRPGPASAETYCQRAVAFAARHGLPVVATHPVQFLHREDFKAHEARVCIAEGYILGDPRRPRQFSGEQYFKTQTEMETLFADMPEALANSVEIARRCNLTVQLGCNRLPPFPVSTGITLNEYLKERAAAGLHARMQTLFTDPATREAKRASYQQRLEFEIETIVQMGFSGYFLIVADFINWAKHNNVPVGPGRGSGAGSLVAYSLGITDIDPLRYNLLFERFLNPERVSMPDFDIDFCQDERERVIEYVKTKYGAEAVAQIATFGTMAAKAVVRDVGRVLDLPYNFVDQLAKLIPLDLGMTLDKARDMEPQLNERARQEEEVQELLELAQRLEGITRNVGMHAGGVLIAPGKLTDVCPLYCAHGSNAVVSQFDKDDVESIGLVKFDLLGLRTLTVLDATVRQVREMAGNGRIDAALRDFSLENLPLDDAPTYRLLRAGNTSAVFQLESRGIRDLIRRLQPDCFDDLVALVALFRPGPLNSGMVDDFIKRKHGKAHVDYLHPDLEPLLKPTYGVIVYQEQVMQIAQVLAGYSLGSADLLRRAMGKKKPEEMAKHRVTFVNGAVHRGVPQAQAQYLFDLMEKFAEYGFNKSHSVAYALLAYQTAYLKTHFPAAFMAAALSADMADTDKVRMLYDDAIENGLQILPPDINQSGYRFLPIDEKRIRYGLGALKGTGEAAIKAMVQARNGDGPFRDLFDFCRRVEKHLINRRVIESLIRGCAFDCIDNNRARLLASVGAALESADQGLGNQESLFSSEDNARAAA
ncbi:MAG: DNA polymerase III subunit alpha, partial [Burkholderiales bacterium]